MPIESRERQLQLAWQGVPQPAAFTCGANLLSDLASHVHRTGAFR